MQPIYFAHGYREREAPFAAYFGKLARQAGLLPSLDPPSDDVNAAKLERHLSYTKGLIAIVSTRPEGASPHIQFEISMSLRSGKPLLVFLEDDLPDEIIPQYILHRRFSSRSYVRETREHMHALEILRTYIGNDHTPKYQPSGDQRSCMLVGFESLNPNLQTEFKRLIKARGYNIVDGPTGDIHLPLKSDEHARIRTATLAICVLDDSSSASMYYLGALRSSLVPTILLSPDSNLPLKDEIPEVYQHRIISKSKVEESIKLLEHQIELFEEDFIELDLEGKADSYANQLTLAASPIGQYADSTRATIIQELTLGNKFSAEQVGAQGPGAHAHDMTFTKIWNQMEGSIDLSALAGDLANLRNHLHNVVTQPEHDAAIGAVADAELAAKSGDGPTVMQCLAKAGQWALDNASKIGVSLATTALKAALGL